MQSSYNRDQPHERDQGLQRLTNWLALIILLGLGFVWPPADAVEAGREVVVAGPATDDLTSSPHAGTLFLKSSAESPAIPALRQSTSLSARVTANVARVYVTQTFTNQSEDWVEGRYVFPLSTGVAVDELEMQVGDRWIRGEIKPRETAHAVYEQARSEGKRASLVDQNRPNMFTTSVANIAPGATISIKIAYLESLPLRDGRYTLKLPLAITPRYTPVASPNQATTVNGGFAADAPVADTSSLDGAPAGHDAPESSASATPEHVTSAVQTVSIDVDLEPGFPIQSIQSLYHEVSINGNADAKHITLNTADAPADRDFELVWTPLSQDDTRAAAFAERKGDAIYVLLALTPPPATQAHSSGRREVIFIIDTSGSMYGPSIEQARAALQLGVDRLAPTDRFNVIRFSNEATELFRQPQPASAGNRQSARRFIDALHADGGTEMKTALELAFSTPSPEDALRQIVFITDGSVGNENELVKMIHDRIGAGRLFTVGIGAAPNTYFMNEAAAAGRGSYTFIGQRDLVRERMEDLFRKIEQPAIVDLDLRWPGAVTAELGAPLPGDVYAGDPVVISARLNSAPQGLLTLTGRSAGRAWLRQIPIEVVGQQAGVAKLWARERIGALAREGNFTGTADQAKTQITQLALDHHLVSDYTSLVAIDVTPVRPNEAPYQRSQAPTSAPAGSYWANTTGFAQTGTIAPLLTLAGVVALCVAAALLLAGSFGMLMSGPFARQDRSQGRAGDPNAPRTFGRPRPLVGGGQLP
jgi:Ca-activated chloride channel homolog